MERISNILYWQKPKKSKAIKFIEINFIMVIASLTYPTTTWAGRIFHFRGESEFTDAAFLSTDPLGCDCSVNPGCIFTGVSVFAAGNRIQSSPGPGTSSSSADIAIGQSDCTGTPLVDAFCCAGPFCTGPLADQGFQVSPNLDSATLNVTLGCFDFLSLSFFNVDVDLDWTGTGNLSRTNSHSHNSFSGCTINFHLNGTSRTAQASGTVSKGTTNFTPDPSGFADLGSTKGGEVDIGCSIPTPSP